MNEYEITYLTTAQLADEARAELDGSIDTIIDKMSGSVDHVEATTRRRFFYPIKKQSIGFSRTINVMLDPSHIEEARQAIKKLEGVLRVAVLQTPRREEVTMAIFDEIDGPAATPGAAPRKPAKEVTMAEVEEKIEEALEEEVK